MDTITWRELATMVRQMPREWQEAPAIMFDERGKRQDFVQNIVLRSNDQEGEAGRANVTPLRRNGGGERPPYPAAA